jgi:hypothetical protein
MQKMKKHKHTQGPWFAVVTETTGGGNPTIWDITCKNGGIIAESIGHNEADAMLISAAPDMKDALQAICDAFGDQDSILIDQCKAALAKAKGAA